LGGPFIALWIGPKFADAGLLLAILAVGEFLPNTQVVTGSVLLASARARVLAAFAIMETIAVCLLTVILIPALGLIGAGLAIAVPAFLFRGVGPLIQACLVVGVPVRRYLTHAIAPAVACALAPSALVALLAYNYPPSTWPLFVAYAGAYTVVFAACYGWMLGRGLPIPFAKCL